MSVKREYVLLLMCLLAVFSVICGCITNENPTGASLSTWKEDGDMTVAFIDVGHGDCAVITSGSDTIVVDTGSVLTTERVLDYLYCEHTEDIDYMFITHPHADHDGGVSAIYNYYTVHRYYDNKNASRGDIIDVGDIRIELLNPVKGKKYSDVNDSSIVMRLMYKGSSILLTGDAEKSAENDMIESGCNLDADVIKIGHHGSKTSSTYKFLQAVSPSIAVISCNDKYGNPSQEVIERLVKLGAITYITGRDGDVELKFCDNGISIRASNIDEVASYDYASGKFFRA